MDIQEFKDRERKLKKRRFGMRIHGKGLAQIYRDVIRKRLKRGN